MTKTDVSDAKLKGLFADLDLMQAREVGVQELRIKNLQKVVRQKDKTIDKLTEINNTLRKKLREIYINGKPKRKVVK